MRKNQSHWVYLYQLCHLMFNIWERKSPEAFQNRDVFQVCGESRRQGWHLTWMLARAGQGTWRIQEPHTNRGGTSVGSSWGLVKLCTAPRFQSLLEMVVGQRFPTQFSIVSH